MKCPNCGNEVSQGEAFCGHCGTPTSPPTHATEMVQTPLSPRNGLLGTYNTANPYGGQKPGSVGPDPTISQPPSNPSMGRTGAFQDNPFVTGQKQPGQFPGPTGSNPTNSSPEFYQDATEAISATPKQFGSGGLNFPSTMKQNSLPGQTAYSSSNPFLQNSYTQPASPFTQHGQNSQPGTYAQNNSTYSNFGTPQTPYPVGSQFGGFNQNRPPHRQQSPNTLLLIALGVGAFLLIIFMVVLFAKNNSTPQTAATPTATSAPKPSPTAAPSPTVAPTDTPTPVLTPTAVPTPPPDPGFTWCSTNCNTLGFEVEYPASWSATPTSSSVQAINPQQSEITATFKKPGIAYPDATQAINGEITTVYAAQPGFVPPAGAGQGNTTIGGENWTFTTIHYTLNDQPVRVEILSTIHQGATYVIELQAYEGEYDQVNQQFFVPIVGHFQFR